VPDVVDVVAAAEVVVVVEWPLLVVVAAEVLVVEDEPDGDGLLEHAASTRAHAGTSRRRADRVRDTLRMAEVYDGPLPKWGLRLRGAAETRRRRQERKGADPMTEARSIERRWGQ
jgi:hypothetical protein